MTDAGWKGFSNIPLRPEDKRAIADTPYSAEDALDYLVDLATAKYKITVSFDSMNEAVVVSATGRGRDNPGLTMTQRHSSLVRAIAAHQYAHNLVDGTWPEPVDADTDHNW